MRVIENLSEVLLVRTHRYDIFQERNTSHVKSLCGRVTLEKHGRSIDLARNLTGEGVGDCTVEICEECQRLEAALVAEARSTVHGMGHHRDGPITACGQNAHRLVITAKLEEITCDACLSYGPDKVWG